MSNEESAPQADVSAPASARPAAATRRSSTGGKTERVNGLGRRKTAVARVSLKPGDGVWKINGRTLEDYFPRGILQQAVSRPLVATDTHGQYDVFIRVAGGGLAGQANAVRLGLSRALLKVDEGFRTRLRAEELLTRDAREVERKKPGRPKARKRFQFSKR